jgi:hypothetical protein
MKRKIVALLLIATLCIVLFVGCGKRSGSVPATLPTAPDTSVANIYEPGDYYEYDDDSDGKAELFYPNEYQTEQQEPNPAGEISGANTPLANGIVAVSSTDSEVYLKVIDPDSGRETGQRAFRFPENSTDNVFFLTPFSDYYPYLHRMYFDADYSRFAIGVIDEYGQQHAGWVNADGTYTNVTAPIVGAPGDFSPAVSHKNGFFSADGYFNFMENGGGVDGSSIWKRVPIGNPVKEALEMADDSMVIRFTDGSVMTVPWTTFKLGPHWWDSALPVLYGDESLEFPLGGMAGHYTGFGNWGWLDKQTYITYPDDYGSHGAIAAIDIGNGYERRVIVPLVSGLWNKFPVVSPDKSMIALEHNTQNGEIGVYIVSANGGEPHRLIADVQVNGTWGFVSGENWSLFDWR